MCAPACVCLFNTWNLDGFSLNLLRTLYVLGSQIIYCNRTSVLAAGTKYLLKLYTYITENNKMVTWIFVLGSKRGSDNNLINIAASITKIGAQTDYQVRSNYERKIYLYRHENVAKFTAINFVNNNCFTCCYYYYYYYYYYHHHRHHYYSSRSATGMGKYKYSGEKPVALSLSLPRIPHGLAWELVDVHPYVLKWLVALSAFKDVYFGCRTLLCSGSNEPCN